MEDELRFEGGIGGWFGDEALLSEQIGLWRDNQTDRWTDRQSCSPIVRKSADGPDYIPLLFPLVTAATSLICHISLSLSLSVCLYVTSAQTLSVQIFLHSTHVSMCPHMTEIKSFRFVQHVHMFGDVPLSPLLSPPTPNPLKCSSKYRRTFLPSVNIMSLNLVYMLQLF
jgi:hypothetical protein